MKLHVLTSGALIAAAAALRPPSALACGGCFAPAGAAQTVTDHRMVLSVSSTSTTLWDQFSYAGNPAEFSWILPITYSPQVSIHLADNRFMTVLDNLSVPVIYAPQAPYQYCFDPRGGGFADAAAADVAGDAGVVVYRQEVVGPYDVAIVGGSDPMAIRNWLTGNGYAVQPSVVPVLDHYTSLHMDFVALRLRPGAGINRMTPVRVTVPGSSPTLPLRMISAGIADKVGLLLLVLANTRMEAQNFQNAQVHSSDLTYDFNSPTNPPTDFLHAEDRINTAMGGRVWITESALVEYAPLLSNLAASARGVLTNDAGGCGASADGGIACDQTDPTDDMTVALDSLGQDVTLTRMHANFGGAELNQDLVLTTSTAPALAREYEYGVVLNRPPPPPPCDAGSFGYFDGGASSDAGGSSQDARVGADNDAGPPTDVVLTGGGGCSAQPGAPGSLAFGGAMMGVSLAWVARRRRRNNKAVV